MEIQCLNARELQDYLESDQFFSDPVIPITRHRAASHFANPRLAPEDVIMIVAREQGRMVGYLGVFADQLHLNGNIHKGGWLSCMWVDPNQRGKGIAKQLLRHALDSWDQGILVTEFTPAAKGLYDRSEAFVDLAKPSGIRAFLRFELHDLIPRRRPGWAWLKWPLWILDGLLNVVNDLRLQMIRTAEPAQWEYFDQLSDEDEAFIHQYHDRQLSRRGKAELNWMIRNPLGAVPAVSRQSGTPIPFLLH